MTEKHFEKIGSIVVSLAFIALIVWGYLTHYVTTSANITGIYYREIEGELGEKWDMYLSLDSSKKDYNTYTYYYVLKSEDYPRVYARVKGKYAGHKINRMIATLCYDPVEKDYSFLPMFYDPYDIILYEGQYDEYDEQNINLTPDDMSISLDDVKDILLFNKNTMKMADMEFEKIAELPSEYQFYFSLMDNQ